MAQLAEAKKLPIEFLRALGLRDEQRKSGRVVVIPYFDERGTEVARRYRLSLDGKNRFLWERGARVGLYGLNRLDDARRAGEVLLVEGESDCWTAWYHNIAALGVPGKSVWRPEWADLLQGLQVFIWQEPGAADFARRIGRDLPEALVIEAPEGIKDISEAHCRGKSVVDLLQSLKAQARPVSTLPQAPASEGPPYFRVLPRFQAQMFAEWLLERYRFWATGKASRGDFYRYDDRAGLWRDDAESFLDRLLWEGDILPDEWKRTYTVNEIIAGVRAQSWRPENLPEPPLRLIPFKNGVYDLKTAKLRPFAAEDYFTWCLPWPYDPSAESDFLREKIGNFTDEIRTHFWELLAYCLYREYPFQRFFLWVGRGSNGKSFLALTLAHALGMENVSGVSLADLQNNRFAGASLYRKLANIAGEVSYADLEHTDLLKKATGTDFLQAERKYRDSFQFENHAKLLFLTNEVPKTRDTTEAFYRRAFIVPFEQRFIEDPRVLDELKSLARSAAGVPEFAWLLAQAVKTLHELIQRDFKFTGTLTPDQAKAIYEKLSNPLTQFIEETCERTRDPGDYVLKSEFSERLNDWLSSKGHNRYSDRRLGREMGDLGFESGQRGEGRWWAWLGLRWK